jgi:hypothetical protein
MFATQYQSHFFHSIAIGSYTCDNFMTRNKSGIIITNKITLPR